MVIYAVSAKKLCIFNLPARASILFLIVTQGLEFMQYQTVFKDSFQKQIYLYCPGIFYFVTLFWRPSITFRDVKTTGMILIVKILRHPSPINAILHSQQNPRKTVKILQTARTSFPSPEEALLFKLNNSGMDYSNSYINFQELLKFVHRLQLYTDSHVLIHEQRKTAQKLCYRAF